MQHLTGIGVSPGIASGRAVILIQRAQVLRYRIPATRIDHEIARLEKSGSRSREQLQEIRARVARRRGRELASLFDAQLLMVDDPMLLPRAASLIREQSVNAEWAIQQAFDELTTLFEEVADPYMRERQGDVADLVGRLKMNLRHGVATTRDLLGLIEESSVLIADELTPSLAAQVDWTKVRGFATDVGSRTYHTAILARSLEVPAIVGLHDASRLVQPGQLVMIDAGQDELIVEPDQETLARAVEKSGDRRPAKGSGAERQRPATTADGVRIRLDANIEFPVDLAAARYAGAEGIGLYRSEFLLTGRREMPSEDEQYETYRSMVEGMAPAPVTIRTFSVGFEERTFDELAGAREVAARIGADHHEVVLRAADAADLLPRVVAAYDEPFGDSSMLPTFAVSELAARHVKVTLSGEGGDELFGGYQTYVAALLAPRLGRPARALLPLIERIPSSSRRVSLDYKARRFARAATLGPVERMFGFKEILSADARDGLLGPGGRADPVDRLRGRWAETAGADDLARLQDLDEGIYLADDLLTKSDRASMAHSLEVRVPFCDVHVAAFAHALPRAMKVRRLKTKRLLRQAVAPLLPDKVVQGPKRGFSIPAAAWLRGPLLPLARDVLSPDALRSAGLFDPAVAGRLLDEHADRRDDHSRALWGLVCFALWSQRR